MLENEQTIVNFWITGFTLTSTKAISEYPVPSTLSSIHSCATNPSPLLAPSDRSPQRSQSLSQTVAVERTRKAHQKLIIDSRNQRGIIARTSIEMAQEIKINFIKISLSKTNLRLCKFFLC